MIPQAVFVDNLKLISAAASDSDLTLGTFIECGTWRGGMAAAMIEIGGPERHYAFFDSFAGLPPVADIDGSAALDWQTNPAENYHDNCTASRAEFEATLERTHASLAKVRINEGWFDATIPGNDCGPIAVLRLDGDWYASTMTCLNGFWDQLLPNGLIILDDYGVWDGCTRAVHDFLSRRAAPEAIATLSPSGTTYIRKRGRAA